MAVYEIKISKKKCCCFFYVGEPKGKSALFINGEVFDLSDVHKRILNSLLEKQGVPLKKDDLLALWSHKVVMNNVEQAIHLLHQIPGFKQLIKSLPRDQSYFIKNYVNKVMKKNDSFSLCAICGRNPNKPISGGEQGKMEPPGRLA